MPRRVLALLALALATLLPAAAPAQDNAVLVADSVRLEGERVLVAEGNVEVFHLGTRLTAERIVYDGATDRLQIEGPLRYSDGPDLVILGDSAELDRDLTDGILRSARMVLAEQFQVAAPQAERIDGRFTQMSRAVASSCQVCPNRPTPLWEIRARRVTHDRATGQIYFDDAQFRVAGLPIAYLPRLRLPDATVDRARGFPSGRALPPIRRRGLCRTSSSRGGSARVAVRSRRGRRGWLPRACPSITAPTSRTARWPR